MDMKKILAAFDNATNKQSKSAAGVNDMRRFVSIVKESALNTKDLKGDYQAKSKALQDLSMNKDVDQKAVQQRRLDLDKEARSKGVKEESITSFEENTLGGDVNAYLLSADKINTEVMAQIEKIKISADQELLKELMDKFNAFMTAYHAVGKEILQPDLFKDSMGETQEVQTMRYKKDESIDSLGFKDYAALIEAKNKINTR
jgi:hypothetical protein